ncbi:hypothetical protein OGM63_05700 [Plectonema radiosum NIES-515]|uniref:Uncharacterized protein n=1 Tax=Plectonema radiosum NIES-515 TaxID=2986073 RepID=A0ABT3AVH0_9CYAN|nr:hypothetical protein [Plectonema radiosum]MCV3213025.1 hypothetical protein [Plectonema radiosum NIES-515]
MADKKVAHVVTIEGKKYMALLPDIYTEIKTVVGIEKAPSPDNTTYAGKLNISTYIAQGDIVRIRCRLENKKIKSILCVAEKFASAMGGLLSKKVGGVDVRTTNIPRRMRLG